MSEKPPVDPQEESKWHRHFAVTCFNRTWRLIEKQNRTPDEDAEMLASTFASRHHWGVVGDAKNRAIGDWQISHVFALLNQPALSMTYARRSLDECEKHGLGDFVIAFAYEAIARAAAIAENAAERDKALQQARDCGNQIAEQDDRDWFFKSLATVQGYAG